MTTNDNDLTVRPIRIGDGVRDAVRREMESRPESPHVAQRRADERAYAQFIADLDADLDGDAHMVTPEECIHPGLISLHVPGDPTRFNASEHCWECGADVPAGEL